MRSVHMFEAFLLGLGCPKEVPPDLAFTPPPKILISVRLVTVPNFDRGGGCDPYVKLVDRNGQVGWGEKERKTHTHTLHHISRKKITHNTLESNPLLATATPFFPLF